MAQTDGHDAPWLIDKLVPCLAAMVDEIVIGFEDTVGEPVVAHKLPDPPEMGKEKCLFAGFRPPRADNKAAQ